MLPIEDRELLNQTMVGLNVHPDTIATLMQSFDRAAENLVNDPVPQVPQSSFGGSYTGGHRLATNAEMAHAAVADELRKMAAGLRGMAESLQRFESEVDHTTAQTQTQMRLYEASVDCVSAPRIDTGSCSLPNDSED